MSPPNDHEAAVSGLFEAIQQPAPRYIGAFNITHLAPESVYSTFANLLSPGLEGLCIPQPAFHNFFLNQTYRISVSHIFELR